MLFITSTFYHCMHWNIEYVAAMHISMYNITGEEIVMAN